MSFEKQHAPHSRQAGATSAVVARTMLGRPYASGCLLAGQKVRKHRIPGLAGGEVVLGQEAHVARPKRNTGEAILCDCAESLRREGAAVWRDHADTHICWWHVAHHVELAREGAVVAI